MASSITSLTLDIAAEKSVRAARAQLAPLGKFCTSFAAAQGDKGDTIKVPVFSRGTAAEFAAGSNDYTSASTAGVSGVSVELNKHPWQSQRLLPDDAMETDAGRDWVEQTGITCVEAVAKYMANEVLVGAMKTANIGSLTISGATARAKLAGIRKSAIAADINPHEATLLLPSALYTDLIDELPFNVIGDSKEIQDGVCDRLLGFARVAELQDEVSYINGSSKKVTLDGMVVANDAIALATRLPLVMNPEKFDVSTVSVPEVGPWSFQLRATGTAATDARYLGAEVIFGTKVLQPSKVLVASTTAA